MSFTSTFLHSFSIPKCSISSSSSLPTSTDSVATSQLPTGIRLRRGAAGPVLDPKSIVVLLGTGFTLSLLGPASASAATDLQSSLLFNEPQNALSLPTWAVHVSIVVEWIAAMTLVWQYGEKSGNESWKGLSWGMVPLLGGAFCACTLHFFYNSESLEVDRIQIPLLLFQKNKVLVALQAMLTVIGNATMCIAAFRIYKSSQERSKNL